jgi:hypothetical protein
VAGTITATATASDNIAMGAGGVQFLIDGQPYGALDAAPPYAVSINTANLTNANHVVVARARDAAGNVANSTAITFTVSNAPPPDRVPPSVAVTSPRNGAIVSGTITATVIATDNVGMGAGGVQFLIDGRPYGAIDRSAPYTLSINTANLTNTIHTIAARGTDGAGNTASSVPILVIVRNTR